MKEKIKYFGKLSSIAFLDILKINFLGISSTIITCILGFLIIASAINSGHSGHSSPIIYLSAFFLARPLSSTLLVINFFISPYIYFVLANKHALTKVGHRVYNDHSDGYIRQIIEKLCSKVFTNNSLATKGADYALLKLKLLDKLKNEPENKWMKKIIAFGISKIQLDDIDFQDKTLSVTDIITNKTIATLQSILEPSMRLFWIMVAIQWLLLVIFWLIKI